MPIFGARLVQLNITSDPTAAMAGTTLSNSAGDFLGTVDADFDTEVTGNTNRMNIGDTVDLDGDGTFEATYEGRFRFNSGSEYELGDGTIDPGAIHIIELSIGGTSYYYLLIRDAEAAAIDADNLQSVTLGTNFVTRNNTNIANFDDAGSFILVCFAQGTKIRAAQGDVPVEALQASDMVWTRDNGLQRIRWVGERSVDGTGRHAPVRFEAGVLGNRAPLLVSPQHRMLVDHPLTELYFAEREVLVPALALVNGKSVWRDPHETITYYHFMFDRHELIEANGCLAESYYPTSRSISGQDRATMEELIQLFPDAPLGQDGYGDFVLPALHGYEARVLGELICH